MPTVFCVRSFRWCKLHLLITPSIFKDILKVHLQAQLGGIFNIFVSVKGLWAAIYLFSQYHGLAKPSFQACVIDIRAHLEGAFLTMGKCSYKGLLGLQ